MRVLAVDPGEKNLGIALSDPTATLASPLTVLKHIARVVDAGVIAHLAGEHEAGLILVGVTYDDEGQLTPEGRRGARLAAVIRDQTDIPVMLWDESGSTQAAQRTRLEMGVSRKKRRGHQDDLAAAIILQDYLDSQSGGFFSPVSSNEEPPKI